MQIKREMCSLTIGVKRNMNTALISFLKNSINTRSLSSYLKKNGFHVVCLFCEDYSADKNHAAIINFLNDHDISLVGISTVTDDYRLAVEVTQTIKSKTDLPVILGGAHANVKPEECLQFADMISKGEGEEALLDLVSAMASTGQVDTSIKNIWFKTDEGVIKNTIRPLEENLDRYPFPDFDLSTQYFFSENRIKPFDASYLASEYSIMTSRGCPYNCHYCYNSYRRLQYKGKGKYLRHRSIENVI